MSPVSVEILAPLTASSHLRTFHTSTHFYFGGRGLFSHTKINSIARSLIYSEINNHPHPPKSNMRLPVFATTKEMNKVLSQRGQVVPSEILWYFLCSGSLVQDRSFESWKGRLQIFRPTRSSEFSRCWVMVSWGVLVQKN